MARPKPAAVAESSACWHGSAVGRTSIFDQGQFFSSLDSVISDEELVSVWTLVLGPVVFAPPCRCMLLRVSSVTVRRVLPSNVTSSTETTTAAAAELRRDASSTTTTKTTTTSLQTTTTAATRKRKVHILRQTAVPFTSKHALYPFVGRSTEPDGYFGSIPPLFVIIYLLKYILLKGE